MTMDFDGRGEERKEHMRYLKKKYWTLMWTEIHP